MYLGPTSTSITVQDDSVKAAAAKPGWRVKVIVFPQTPEGAASAMAQAVPLQPDAILPAGFREHQAGAARRARAALRSWRACAGSSPANSERTAL